DLWANPECTPMPDLHLTQQLSKMGAKVILHAVNGGRWTGEYMEVVRKFHECNLRMRAKAGNLWIVTVDNSHPANLPCSAASGVIDPSGNWAYKAPNQGEQLFAHTLSV